MKTEVLQQLKKINGETKEKIIILFLLGVFLFLIATPVDKMANHNKKAEKGRVETEKISTENAVLPTENIKKDAYIEMLENKLEKTIGGMEGAGKVLVMVTLKDGGELILDKNLPYENQVEKSTEEGKVTEKNVMKSDQETVLVEEGGTSSPIIVQQLTPQIAGVVVVCEGGDDSELALHIKEAVMALFSIDANKIVVCKLHQ